MKAANTSGTKIPIDLVYAYVDGDEAHTGKRRRYIAAIPGEQLTLKEAHSRLLHVGEIRFSVRSALRYMPWLRRIFIVTDSQMPPVDHYLIESGRVKIVDHREIIPDRYLPTFNAVTIESLIHRIDGLSEIFLYNNDDFMHFSSIPEETFAVPGEDGNVNLMLHARYAIPRRYMHLASRFLPAAGAAVLANSYTGLISNAYRVLKAGPYPLRWDEIIVPRHFTNIFRKQTALRIEDEFAGTLDANRKHRFVIPGVFGYTTLAYTLERKWNPGDFLHLPGSFSRSAKFSMFDFTALIGGGNRLWPKILSCRMPFACLNNIPPSGKSDFERVMREKGLGNPCDESQPGETLMQERNN